MSNSARFKILSILAAALAYGLYSGEQSAVRFAVAFFFIFLVADMWIEAINRNR